MPVKMSRAFNASRQIVSIEDVPSGKACRCTCIDCDEPLVAKKGQVNRHYFSHEPTSATDELNVNPRECHWGPETELHILAKEVLAEDRQLSLPIGITNPKSELLTFETVQLEFPEGSRIPDVSAYVNGEKILIEIAVTHFCDEDKIADLKRINATCIELDFSKFSLDVEVLSKNAVLEYLVTCPKKWLSVAPVGPIAEAIHQHERHVLRDLAAQNRKQEAQALALKQQIQRYEDLLAEHQPEIVQIDAEITQKETQLADLKQRIWTAVTHLNDVEQETRNQQDLLVFNASRLKQLDNLSNRETALESASKVVDKRMHEMDEEVLLRIRAMSVDADLREAALTQREKKLHMQERDFIVRRKNKEEDLLTREKNLKQSETDFIKRLNHEAERLGKDQFERFRRGKITQIRDWENYYDLLIKKIDEARRKFGSRVTFPETPPALERFNFSQNKSSPDDE
ncbi:hypothetical protein [Aeromonas veronii]|uniref:Competence protein n=1 Tax=Aeromonas veronii TaxID=654 RepID=A0A2T4N0J6_AERVE|nr:hypothetical protein [Aeromonas veronii]MCX0445429.1 hypothetical protein [Aeromonas veronii]PTH80375.1 hypothetical protein DAA48_14270 [Aeromonas veronii]RDE59465.1 hypothetical protein DV708_21900 [Aeromonas veronii]UZE61396.1 hypothetical protein ONR73_09385 [Aeromonas veronii]